MIIWGSGGGSNVLGELGVQDCPVCAKRVPFNVVLEYTYRHVWYVLSWVTGREYFAVCSHCNNGQPLEKAEAKRLFPNDGISFFRKRGLLVVFVLFVALMGWAKMGQDESKQQYLQYLETPQNGDMYLVNFARLDGSGFEDAKRAYGYMIQVQHNDDMLVFLPSKTAWTTKKGVRKALATSITPDDYALDQPLGITIETIRDLVERNIIYEIRR